MTISLVRIIGAACAAVTAFALMSAISPLGAQSVPLSLAPNAPAPKQTAPVATTVHHDSKAQKQNPVRPPVTSGTPDVAFLSARHYLEQSASSNVIPVVTESEFSLLDFSAGNVRVVDPDELSEIDLANEPAVLLAQRPDAKPIVQASAAPARSGDPDEDDGVFNRILMTFAGALAMASAMRMIIA